MGGKGGGERRAAASARERKGEVASDRPTGSERAGGVQGGISPLDGSMGEGVRGNPGVWGFPREGRAAPIFFCSSRPSCRQGLLAVTTLAAVAEKTQEGGRRQKLTAP